MFKRARLTNFRQHRDLEVHFVPGINAIRGLNEKGKTTLLEAIAYVMFGARIALREPLDEVVTWGEKVSSLKTELDVEVNGVTYLGKRSKSGAEVWLEGGAAPIVTGVDECTRFWETLLGVSAKAATSLMLANQAKLRGALEQGSTAPVALIETLANFKLIDQILALVVEELPNGQTKIIEDRIATLKEVVAQPDTSDTSELERVEAHAAVVLESTNIDRQLAQDACDAHAPAAAKAQTAANDLERAQQAHRNAVEQDKNAAAALAAIVVPAAPDAKRMSELRGQIADADSFKKAAEANATLDRLGIPTVEWDEGLPSLEEAIKTTKATKEFHVKRSTELGAALGDKRVQLGRTEAKLIKETQCAFCNKDLTDVPEVVTRNSALSVEIQALRADIDRLTEARSVEDDCAENCADEIASMEAVLNDGARRHAVYERYNAYITLDTNFVPARWTWVGPDLSKPPTDPVSELRTLEDAQRAHDQANGRKQQAETSSVSAFVKRDTAQRELEAAQAAANEGKPDLVKAVELADAFAQASARFEQAQEAHRQAASALATAQAVRREREAAKTRVKADLQREEDNLTKMAKGNVLIGKLRAARPQIADKLWTVVLHSVSAYFSSIRGTASTVTRADNGFLVDGKGIDGLSGSTLDALGLAIRIALVKTFLPNARFMVLDEPAAACDDGRETNMIGLVASVDFDQVILVTHSGLADAFAHQVIQL